MPRSVTASAPGSLMLAGEHAVLHGRLAVVCAVNRRISVTVTPRKDGQVHVASDLAAHATDTKQLAMHPRLAFVMTALKADRDLLGDGIDLRIEAGFSSTIGFGSSAAVAAATHAAVRRMGGGDAGPKAVFLAARATIREAQRGVGSGADAAAAVYGGWVGYRAEPLEIRPVPVKQPLTAVYCGYKTPTPEVIARVEALRLRHPALFAAVFDAMDGVSARLIEAAGQGDWAAAGQLLNIGHGLLEALGVGTPELAEIVHALRGANGILGAKISGSGLGDCAVGLGHAREALPYEVMHVETDPEGLRHDET